MRFQVGDKVRCVKDHPHGYRVNDILPENATKQLQLGKIYTVSQAGVEIHVAGIHQSWMQDRFELAPKRLPVTIEDKQYLCDVYINGNDLVKVEPING